MAQDQYSEYHQAALFLESSIQRVNKYERGDGLKRLAFFLKLLGDPQNDMRFIHITGTSGKGSVASKIHAGLLADHKNAGLFTSPHPTTYIERIKVGNKYIAPEEFVKILEEIKPAIDRCYHKSGYEHPGWSDMLLAIALLYFKRRRCTYAVLEASVGGRYDTTNVIPSPAAAIITNISLDHTGVIGDNKSEIALNKAGIIKPGTQVYTSEQSRQLLPIFRKKCRELNVPLVIVRARPGTKVDYRQINTTLANEVLTGLGIKVNKKAIEKRFALPARTETVQRRPRVILDGAHNSSKMEALASYIKNLTKEKIILIIGVKYRKDIEQVIEPIAPFAKSVFITRSIDPRNKTTAPSVIADAFKKFNPGAKRRVILDPTNALHMALEEAKRSDIVIITGSFYLAGRLRTNWYPEEKILRKRSSF
tara:strand:+ start:466 stop:1731 length:1266 start_codon:yes stop_codon:yes gene_type:complete